jgi:hypothetical protein
MVGAAGLHIETGARVWGLVWRFGFGFWPPYLGHCRRLGHVPLAKPKRTAQRGGFTPLIGLFEGRGGVKNRFCEVSIHYQKNTPAPPVSTHLHP